jgi:Domain of unknown function (DUF4440)
MTPWRPSQHLDRLHARPARSLASPHAGEHSTIPATSLPTITGSSGKIVTKKDLLRDFESFHDKLESFENGPMDVQVFGNVAVVHGSVAEKRVRDGKDTSGAFVWMDLLEKRAGKWVVVRSAGATLRHDPLETPQGFAASFRG